jgi:hypothetical protein
MVGFLGVLIGVSERGSQNQSNGINGASLYQRYAKEHPQCADIIKDLMQTTYVDDINSFADTGSDAKLFSGLT